MTCQLALVQAQSVSLLEEVVTNQDTVNVPHFSAAHISDSLINDFFSSPFPKLGFKRIGYIDSKFEYTMIGTTANSQLIINRLDGTRWLDKTFLGQRPLRSTYWNPSGDITVFSSANFQEEKEMIYLIDSGRVKSISENNIVTGKGIHRSYYKTGELRSLWIDEGENQAGFEKNFYRSGALLDSCHVNQDRQEYTSFHENGRLASKGFVINYLWSPVGRWQEWYNNGQLKLEYTYDENYPGRLEGTKRFFDESGVLQSEETYQHGVLIEVID